MTRNFIFEYQNKVYPLYDYSPYNGYFDITYNEEENCIEGMSYDHDIGGVLEGEIHTLFEYEGNNIDEWDNKLEFDKHQDTWKRFKEFAINYQEFMKSTEGYKLEEE